MIQKLTYKAQLFQNWLLTGAASGMMIGWCEQYDAGDM
jgi:hypothetical protein